VSKIFNEKVLVVAGMKGGARSGQAEMTGSITRKFSDEPMIDSKDLHFARRLEKFVPLVAVDRILLVTIAFIFKGEMLHPRECLAGRV
jgi:hypothetical protein